MKNINKHLLTLKISKTYKYSLSIIAVLSLSICSPSLSYNQANTYEEIKIILNDKNFDVNKTEMLHNACENNDIETVKLLLEHGANPDKITNGVTPLCIACINNNIEILKLLLSHGANTEIPLKENEIFITPLFIACYSACEKDCIDAVKLLLEYGANPNKICGDYSGNTLTPLFIACGYNNIETVKLLLEYGANPNMTIKNNKDGCLSPLFIACIDVEDDWNDNDEDIKTIKLLLEYGAQIDERTIKYLKKNEPKILATINSMQKK